MPTPITSQFCFTICKVGAEAALKAELARLRPDWRPAFSRPGLVSYKLPAATGIDHQLDAMFVHAYGFAGGRTTPAMAVAAVLDYVASLDLARPPHLHCFARAVYDSAEVASPMAPAATELAAALRASGRFQAEAAGQPGNVVVDVVVVDADHVLFGAHRQNASHSPYPGGVPPLVLPEDAPSRAWLKFEEALLWHEKRLLPGQIAVEVGSAPGGTAFGLLARGAEVYAVDPARMDPRLAVHHVQKSAASLESGDLPASFDWLLLDINDNPGSTLRLAKKLISQSRRKPALILTLKLADWALADDVPKHLARLRAAGYPRARARQLAFGRREIVLLA